VLSSNDSAVNGKIAAPLRTNQKIGIDTYGHAFSQGSPFCGYMYTESVTVSMSDGAPVQACVVSWPDNKTYINMCGICFPAHGSD
jgi:hypothetical protein